MGEGSRRGVLYTPVSGPTNAGSPPVPRWWRGAEPDPDVARRLYVDEGRTESQIAVDLSISRARVAEILRSAGVTRRGSAKPCPVDVDTLHALVGQGTSVTELAGRFEVSVTTVRRWLAEAGRYPVAEVEVDRLRELYVEQQLTTREVAEKLGSSKNTVIRMLVAAGIPRRSRSARRPRGARAAVTDEALATVYQRPDMTVRRAAAHFGVSEEYLRRRVAQAGLIKRIGSFTPHSRYTPAQLQARAGRLYRQGMTMRQVADRLGVTGSTVSRALHAARVPVRGNAVAHGDRSGRLLVDDLYADEQVREALRRFDVHVPDEWTEAGPFTVYAPLPLPAALLQRLYTEIGLSAQHIALVCGVGVGAVKSRLAQLGIPRRSPREPSPWNRRRRQSG